MSDGRPRFCVDYRRLNSITHKDVYPLPRVDDILESVKWARMFSSLDLSSGYWKIPVAARDRDKTVFFTPDELFNFFRMPFGLSNVPATFERLMNRALAGLK